MIKFYLSTVAIYFIIFIADGILTRKQFIKIRDRLRKETNDYSKIHGIFRTTIDYLLLSFVPVIRLMFFIGKQYLLMHPDEAIERIKKNNNE